jgi:predicted GH43/DUF377 family glycosyl hydrolase
MPIVKDEGIVLEKTDLKFENKAVLNPACIEEGGATHMFYRAVGENDVSSIGYCRLADGKIVYRSKRPVLFPEFDYEKRGLEDPRITFLDGTYYLFYTVYDGKNALVAYATSKDLIDFSKRGVISPLISYDEAEELFRGSGVGNKYFEFKNSFKRQQGNDVLLFEKDASLFPKKFDGNFAVLHRVPPGIQIIFFKDFSELTESRWREYLMGLRDSVVMDPRYPFENYYIGGGCPPILTEAGWLLVYHAVENTPAGNIYHAAAALLDRDDPRKVSGRLSKPLFSPVASWEKIGLTHNVVFPTGAIVKDGRLFIYYGAADERIAVKSVDLAELLAELAKSGT